MKKSGFALNYSESLLSLTNKLRNAEERVLGLKYHKNKSMQSETEFKSIASKNGFSFLKDLQQHFPVTSFDESCDEPPRKKACLLNSYDINNDPIQFSNSKVDLNDSINLTNKIDLSFNKKQQKIMNKSEKLAEMLVSFKDIVQFKNISDLDNSIRIEDKNNFFWKVLSNTKFSADKEQCHYFDENKKTLVSNNQTQFLKKYNQNIKHLVIDKAIDQVVTSQLPKLFSTIVQNVGKKLSKLATMTNAQLSINLVEMTNHRFECTQCNYKTNRKSHMIRHQGAVHSMYRPYACGICQLSFNRIEQVRSHIKTNHPNETFSHSLVVRRDVEVVVKNNIDTHKTNGQDNISKDPPLIKKEIETALNLSTKTSNGESSSNKYLQLLNKNMKNDFGALLQPNAANFLNKISTMSNDLECHYCKKTFADLNFLDIHIRNAHSKKSFTCILCGFALTNEMDLNQHMLLHKNHITNNHKTSQLKMQLSNGINGLDKKSAVIESKTGQLDNNHSRLSPDKNSTNQSQIDVTNSNDEEEEDGEDEDDENDGDDDDEDGDKTFSENYKGKRLPRKFKHFFCPQCPDRAPFRYRKSFNKHMSQHA